MSQLSRSELLIKSISKKQIGVEIGPLHNPLTPKKAGFGSLSMDIKCRDDLIKSYPSLTEEQKDRIEDVDIISKATFLESLDNYCSSENSLLNSSTESLDYIVSSHNFEHLPNPIRFLEDCQRCLKENGLLIMAIPISSRCFDVTKPLSSSGDLLDAFIQDRQQPPFGKVFDQLTNNPFVTGKPVVPKTFRLQELDLACADITPMWFDGILSRWNSTYMNCHCWQFNHFSFNLIFEEIRSCGFYSDLDIIECSEQGLEFFVEIQKNTVKNESSERIGKSRRIDLLKKSLGFMLDDLNNQSA